ncbi:TPA: hypothetical protein ROH25_001522 [Enterobacter asburiae]|nr:hypothetical protein [Enterobacter asburiae]HDX4717859.1 hypothetical protein [Enterobacter asburiae]
MQMLKRRSDAIYLTEMGAFIARRIMATIAQVRDASHIITSHNQLL